jgi:hypothetical protein
MEAAHRVREYEQWRLFVSRLGGELGDLDEELIQSSTIIRKRIYDQMKSDEIVVKLEALDDEEELLELSSVLVPRYLPEVVEILGEGEDVYCLARVPRDEAFRRWFELRDAQEFELTQRSNLILVDREGEIALVKDELHRGFRMNHELWFISLWQPEPSL